MKGYILIALLLFSATSAIAQSPSADSLITALDNGYPRIETAVTQYTKGASFRTTSELEQDAVALTEALDMELEPNSAVSALQKLGSFYKDKNLLNEALDFYQLALGQIRSVTRDDIREAQMLKEISTVYTAEGLYNESLPYIYQSLKIFEKHNANTKAVQALYDAMTINYKAFNYEDAVIDFHTALELYNKLPKDSLNKAVTFDMMSGWNTVGLCCRVLNRTKEGLEAFAEADKLAIKSNNQFWHGLINGNRGELLLQAGKVGDAIILMREDLRISIQFKQPQSAGSTASTLSIAYLELNEIEKATRYLDTARMFLRQASLAPNSQQKYLLAQSKLSNATGNYKEAYRTLNRLRIIRDSSFSEEKQQSLAQFKARYELEKKQSRIQLLSHMNDLQNQKIRDQQRLLITSIVFSVLVTGFLLYIFFNYRRQRKKNDLIESQRKEIVIKNQALEIQGSKLMEQNNIVQSYNIELEMKVKKRTEQLQESNNELDKFLYHASHDIRRPIATILGLEQVARLSWTDPDKQYLFEQVAGTARAMDRMLFKLQMAHELNKPIIDYSRINLHQIINHVSNKFDADFHELNMNYTQVQSSMITFYASPTLLNIIFTNLIENAINFRKTFGDEKPFIVITLKTIEKTIVVMVEDNGIGIKEEYLGKIFDLYFRAYEKSKGNGLGLYLVKKAVTLLDGTITVSSTPEAGTVFTVELPWK